MEFTCLTCSKDFETEEIVRQHIIDEHNGKPIEVDLDDQMEVFTCDTCLQDFLSEECVKQHIRCCHKSNPTKKMTKEEFDQMKLPKKMKEALNKINIKKTLVLN